MTGVPVGAVLAGAVLAVLLAALLSAGQAALERLGRTALADLDPARGLPVVLADPHGTAAAARWSRVLLEVLAVALVTSALDGLGLQWWQSVLAVTVVGTAVGVLLVRHVPRTLARAHAPSAVRRLAWLLAAVALAATPLRRLAGDPASAALTGEEIRAMVDRVGEGEAIPDDEREMVRSVLGLGHTIVRAVMVPRTEMITLPAGSPVRKALSLFLRSGYSRVPVVGEAVDDLHGILYLKDVVRLSHSGHGSDETPVDQLVRPAVFVPESKPVDDLLREMQRSTSHIAMVVDEYGGIAGLVTIEDALEEIVGELTDEHDRSGPEVEDLGDGTYRVPARLPVDELGELFGMELEDADVDTVGGLLAKALGRVPLAGASAEVHGLVLAADRMGGRRRQLSTVRVHRAAEPGTTTDLDVASQGATP